MEACLLGAPPKTFGRHVSLDERVSRGVEGGTGKLQMRVEVDDADGAVCASDTAEEG